MFLKAIFNTIIIIHFLVARRSEHPNVFRDRTEEWWHPQQGANARARFLLGMNETAPPWGDAQQPRLLRHGHCQVLHAPAVWLAIVSTLPMPWQQGPRPAHRQHASRWAWLESSCCGETWRTVSRANGMGAAGFAGTMIWVDRNASTLWGLAVLWRVACGCRNLTGLLEVCSDRPLGAGGRQPAEVLPQACPPESGAHRRLLPAPRTRRGRTRPRGSCCSRCCTGRHRDGWHPQLRCQAAYQVVPPQGSALTSNFS